jgi:hypothetical protein
MYRPRGIAARVRTTGKINKGIRSVSIASNFSADYIAVQEQHASFFAEVKLQDYYKIEAFRLSLIR